MQGTAVMKGSRCICVDLCGGFAGLNAVGGPIANRYQIRLVQCVAVSVTPENTVAYLRLHILWGKTAVGSILALHCHGNLHATSFQKLWSDCALSPPLATLVNLLVEIFVKNFRMSRNNSA